MNRPVWMFSALLAPLLLSACAATPPSYWYETPASSSTGLDGTWQGLARNGSTVHYGFDRMGGPVEVNCDPYEDRIRLQVSDGKVNIDIGQQGKVSVQAPIGADGQFQKQMNVSGDTWIYGGVNIFTHQPVLTISGQLDAATGIGSGRIAVTPEKEKLGCYGQFRVGRDSAPAQRSKDAEPFKIQYWINEMETHGMVPRRL